MKYMYILNGYSKGLSSRSILKKNSEQICRAFNIIIEDNPLAEYIIKSKAAVCEWLSNEENSFYDEILFFTDLFDHISICDIEFIFEAVSSNFSNIVKLNRLFMNKLEKRSVFVTHFALVNGIISAENNDIMHHLLKLCCRKIDLHEHLEANFYDPIFSILMLHQANFIKDLTCYETLLQGISMFDFVNATVQYSPNVFEAEWWPLLYDEKLQKAIAHDLDKYGTILEKLHNYMNLSSRLVKNEIEAILSSIEYYSLSPAEDAAFESLYEAYENNGHVLSINSFR